MALLKLNGAALCRIYIYISETRVSVGQCGCSLVAKIDTINYGIAVVCRSLILYLEY